MKVALLGLDSVPPDVLFERLLPDLPNIGKMYRRGMHGTLTTCHPPITVPAWMVMLTGRNPGRLGIYGFRHRKGSAYNEGYIVNSTHVKDRILWDYLADNGLESVIIGIPPGYPPRPVNDGNVISCFLTPSSERPFTYPPELKEEILKAAGGKYEFDVVFRTEDRVSLKKQLFEMTEKRFDVAEYLAKTKPWRFFALHEIGFDRLHHAFWKYFDPRHPKYVRGNEFEGVFREYYSMVDLRIGKMLEVFGEDCITFLLSDHGSKGMAGAFCFNEWLVKEGYLVLKQRPTSVVDIEKADVDWTKTRAWGWGGYYARVFFNVRGRERTGVIEPADLPDGIRFGQQQRGSLVIDSPDMTLEQLEKEYILKVLHHTNWQKKRASEILGINPSTLYRKLVSYGVEKPGREEAELAAETGTEPQANAA